MGRYILLEWTKFRPQLLSPAVWDADSFRGFGYHNSVILRDLNQPDSQLVAALSALLRNPHLASGTLAPTSILYITNIMLCRVLVWNKLRNMRMWVLRKSFWFTFEQTLAS
jgi:hypothetical protein